MTKKMSTRKKKTMAFELNSSLRSMLTYLNSHQNADADSVYLRLASLNQHHGVSDDDWGTALEANDYFHIQNSRDFCGEIRSEVQNGADSRYLKYCDYVENLGTKYFAPEYVGGLQGALTKQIISMLVYLNYPASAFAKYKRNFKSRMKNSRKHKSSRSQSA